MNHSDLKPSSHQSKQEYWNQHIEDWKESSLTQTQYCQEQELKLPTFQYWKSKQNRMNLSTRLLPVSLNSTIQSTTRSIYGDLHDKAETTVFAV
jgi:hypothetical protein